MPKIPMIPYKSSKKEGKLRSKNPKYGWAIKSNDDQFYHILARLLENGVKIWCAEETFNVEDEFFPRGSIIIRNNANKGLNKGLLKKLAFDYGLDIFAVNTALVSSGPDLGSSDFTMLINPRIAIATGQPISTYSFGATWHLLDSRMNSRTSLINVMGLGWQDLSKYNVLILPSGNNLKRILDDSGINKLKDWIKDGGTLISYSNNAAFLADSSVNISSVRLRRQMLNKLDSYESDLAFAKQAENVTIDSVALWDGEYLEENPSKEEHKEALENIKEIDRMGRKFRPQGAILKVNMDPEHWLSFGCGDYVPVLYNTGNVFMAKNPVKIAGRLAEESNLRLGGLLWPEAKSRIAESAWVTQESYGKGQIIIFATEPHFRG